ncbi:MAG: hypothetical protein EA422_04155 [Gemmatimonadales bacterium]|nr:MAG: hypothetical protein EA422_04155 [Gemmatimonadales bacterium]
MHDTLRSRILRRLETLPEAQLYQILDYIEFLESRYANRAPQDPGGLQRWAERLEDSLRKRTVNPGNLREAFQLISVADRVLNSVSEAGRQFLEDFQYPEEMGAPPDGAHRTGGGGPDSSRPQGDRPSSDRPERTRHEPDALQEGARRKPDASPEG